MNEVKNKNFSLYTPLKENRGSRGATPLIFNLETVDVVGG